MNDILLVRDLMTVGVPTCPADTPITDLARFLLDGNLEALIVLDQEGHAAGTIGQDELVKAYAHDDWHHLTAEQIMREDIPQIPPDIPSTAAAQIMRDQGVRVLFLMHHAEGINWPAAMISYRHLLRHLAARDHAELKDLGIRAEREAPLETFIRQREAARQKASSHQKE
jgi:CBS-domain-containing membrane protein